LEVEAVEAIGVEVEAVDEIAPSTSLNDRSFDIHISQPDRNPDTGSLSTLVLTMYPSG